MVGRWAVCGDDDRSIQMASFSPEYPCSRCGIDKLHRVNKKTILCKTSTDIEVGQIPRFFETGFKIFIVTLKVSSY